MCRQSSFILLNICTVRLLFIWYNKEKSQTWYFGHRQLAKIDVFLLYGYQLFLWQFRIVQRPWWYYAWMEFGKVIWATGRSSLNVWANSPPCDTDEWTGSNVHKETRMIVYFVLVWYPSDRYLERYDNNSLKRHGYSLQHKIWVQRSWF